MKIHGIDGMSADQVRQALNQGARCVAYTYCISIIVMSFKRSSDLYLLQPGESDWGRRIGFSLASLALGPWGIPWGPIWTIGALFTNLAGGRNLSAELLNSMGGTTAMPSAEAAGAKG